VSASSFYCIQEMVLTQSFMCVNATSPHTLPASESTRCLRRFKCPSRSTTYPSGTLRPRSPHATPTTGCSPSSTTNIPSCSDVSQHSCTTSTCAAALPSSTGCVQRAWY
jgi:hypothetical protein